MASKTGKKRSSAVLLLLVAGILAVGVLILFGPNLRKAEYLYVRTGTTYPILLAQLTDQGYVRNAASFDFIARRWGLAEHVRPGRYAVKKGMSNYELIRKLRNGSQAPVKLVINKLRTKQDFVNIVSANLEADSLALKAMLANATFLKEFGLDTNTVMCGILPDTYEFYWNTPAEKAFRKIQKNYTRFWTEERKRLAKSKGLTPHQATIIASIIDEETNRSSDKPNIASVYLNRIEKGMKLQADPTVKFAIGDFTIRRVTGAMLKTVSPYNTYQNTGIPPGPICTPSVGSVDAVLNAPKTNYIYFCANASLDGGSAFAATDAEHMKNARAYQQALNARGIH